ncbi:unnamed protein product [Rotaria sp. Silwood2]|nr:unnamed protein product [Rotaria sp. Silwood2]CAF4380883.1 unnamed protein product [Rotaria sp. Silwood2]
MESLNIPLDRAHRFVLGTQLEHLEHGPGRLGGRITCRFGPSCIRSNQTAIRPRHQQEILIIQEHKNIYQKSSTPSQ